MHLVKVIKEPVAGTGISEINTITFIVDEDGHYLSKNFKMMDRLIDGRYYDKFGSPIAFSCSPLRAQRIAKRLNKYGTASFISAHGYYLTLVISLLLAILFTWLLLPHLNF